MNELTDFDIARLLSDSLKYVRLYRSHTVVVKYGGNAMKNPELQQQVMHDLVLLSMIGIRIVVARRPWDRIEVRARTSRHRRGDDARCAGRARRRDEQGPRQAPVRRGLEGRGTVRT